jgi:hypothetical protein
MKGLLFFAGLLLLSDLPCTAGYGPSHECEEVKGKSFDLFLSVREPVDVQRPALIQKLSRDGYKVVPGEARHEAVLHLSDRQIRRLFHGRVLFKRLAASSSDEFICEPVVEGLEIPKGYESLIESAYVDPQR